VLTGDAGALAGVVALSAAILVLGGIVKGTLGVGLPLVVIPMLSLFMPAPRAMGLLMVPVLLSNVWQSIEAGRPAYARRFAVLMAVQFVVTVLTVRFSRDLPAQAFNPIIAVAVLTAVVLMALQPKGEVSPTTERWASPLVGALAGLMSGLSTLTGPIIITYLMALRLRRDEFVGSISIIYLVGAIPTYGSMLWWGRFGWVEVAWSVAALVPMFVGMKLGSALRHRLSEKLFRGMLFTFLCLLALLLLFK
jgi:uncharacterized membrane protein YfcA